MLIKIYCKKLKHSRISSNNFADFHVAANTGQVAINVTGGGGGGGGELPGPLLQTVSVLAQLPLPAPSTATPWSGLTRLKPINVVGGGGGI